MLLLDQLHSTMAERVAEVALRFHKVRTGHAARGVTVVLSDDTLVVTLHNALSPAEIALAQTPEGAAKVQEYHRELFEGSAAELHEQIHLITGVAVHEAAVGVETASGVVVHAFTSGTIVHVFRLDGVLPFEDQGGTGRAHGPAT